MVLVQTSQGMLEGERLHLKTGTGDYYSFKGVPYAAPPLGPLRFKGPSPPLPWKGVRSAKKHGPICPQIDLITRAVVPGDEDCLYINIYSPIINNPSNRLLPVMFWIHGGGFMSGSGNSEFYGPDFLIQHGVMLVTFNYRLGALGFLCLDTEEVPGNAGMKDQVSALRWVHENIENFGGDPDNVTIFGESAGGASVGFHLTSPMSKGLFRRAILQSGSDICEWANGSQLLEKSFQLGIELGFTTDDPNKLVNYLRQVPAEQLVEVKVPSTFKEKCEEGLFLDWNIVKEKRFENIELFNEFDKTDSIHSRSVQDVDILMGYTRDEGVMFIVDIEKQAQLIDRYLEYMVPTEIALKCPLQKQLEIGKKIKEFYFKGYAADSKQSILKFYSLCMVNFGVIRFLKYFKSQCESSAYLYLMSYVSDRNVIGKGMLGTGKVQCGVSDTASGHGDDLMYLFDMEVAGLPLDKTSESYSMILKMTKMWTNFSKFGNPTPDDSLGAVWTPYSLNTEAYLDIGKTLTPGVKLDQQEIAFWEKIYEEYLHECI